MSWIRPVAAELLGLFVDDGVFALAILGWIVAFGVLLPRVGVSPDLCGPLMAIGLAATLVASALRTARHRATDRPPSPPTSRQEV